MLEPVKVSVGLLVYNQESYVRESIEGIFFKLTRLTNLLSVMIILVMIVGKL